MLMNFLAERHFKMPLGRLYWTHEAAKGQRGGGGSATHAAATQEVWVRVHRAHTYFAVTLPSSTQLLEKENAFLPVLAEQNPVQNM